MLKNYLPRHRLDAGTYGSKAVSRLGWQSSVTAGLAEQCYSWQSSVAAGLAEQCYSWAGRVVLPLGWQKQCYSWQSGVVLRLAGQCLGWHCGALGWGGNFGSL